MGGRYMSSYQSNIELAAMARLIRQHKRVSVTSHAKPDGDAFGSVISLAAALRELGQDVEAWFMPPVPANFRTLKGYELAQEYKGSGGLSESDLIILVDTGAWSQVAPMREELSRLEDRLLVIDHHLVGDIPAAWRYVDGEAGACCELLAQLIKQWELDNPAPVNLFTQTVSEALFVGIASDTGWFRFSNTRPQTHDLAAKLLRHGVEQNEIYLKLEQSERPQKLALQTRVMDSLKLLAQGRVAIMVVRATDFDQTQALLEETERFVDLPQVVSTVQVVVLITETPSTLTPATGQDTAPVDKSPTDPVSTIRLSFRSKPGPLAVNVAKFAQQFGGGGHARAAGAKVQGVLEQVVEQVTQAAVAAVASTCP